MKRGPGRLVLLGHPVGHSLSPAFQNAALESADSPLRYEALDVPPAALRSTVDSLRADRGAGNVTVPHKEAMFALCDETTPVARRVGAVNTFMMRDESLVGHNTDVEGVAHAVRELIGGAPRDLVVGVIGAGGAAAAVLAAVEGWPGSRAVVGNRTPDRAAALVARFASVARVGDASEIAAHADIVVNATSLGFRDADALAVDLATLRPECAVLDLVYSKNETRLVREARARGHAASDGLPMLVAQGAAAFEWWFARLPDVEVMWLAVGRTRAGTPPA